MRVEYGEKVMRENHTVCHNSGASEGRKKWNGSSAPGGVMGPPKGVPHSGGSGGLPQEIF